MPPDHDVRPGIVNAGRVVAAASLGAALSPLNSTMVAVALPTLQRDFLADAATVTLLVVTGYLVGTLICQLPAGTVADRIGYGRALAWGRIVCAVGAAVGAFAPSLAVVAIGRVLMAAGGALMVPTSMALLRIATPPERRARAFGTFGMIMAGAAAVGPAVGGVVASALGWRWLFAINLPVLLCSWFLQGRASDARTDAQTLDLSVFRQPVFVSAAGVVATQNLGMYSLLILVPFQFGAQAAASAGLAIVAMTATMALASPVGGRLAERMGNRAVVCVGGIVSALAVASIGRFGMGETTLETGIRLVPVGLGIGLSSGPAQAAGLSAIPGGRSGVGSAALSMMRYVGSIAGTLILGSLLASEPPRVQLAIYLFGGVFALSALFGAGLKSTTSGE